MQACSLAFGMTHRCILDEMNSLTDTITYHWCGFVNIRVAAHVCFLCMCKERHTVPTGMTRYFSLESTLLVLDLVYGISGLPYVVKWVTHGSINMAFGLVSKGHFSKHIDSTCASYSQRRLRLCIRFICLNTVLLIQHTFSPLTSLVVGSSQHLLVDVNMVNCLFCVLEPGILYSLVYCVHLGVKWNRKQAFLVSLQTSRPQHHPAR